MTPIGHKQYQTGEEINYGGKSGKIVSTSNTGFTTIKLDSGETLVVKSGALQKCVWDISSQIENYNKDIKTYESKLETFKTLYANANSTMTTKKREIRYLFGREGVSSAEELTKNRYDDFELLSADLSAAKAEKRKSGHGIRWTALTLGNLFGKRGDMQSLEIIARHALG